MLNSFNLIQCELKQSTKYQSEIVVAQKHYALDVYLSLCYKINTLVYILLREAYNEMIHTGTYYLITFT